MSESARFASESLLDILQSESYSTLSLPLSSTISSIGTPRLSNHNNIPLTISRNVSMADMSESGQDSSETKDSSDEEPVKRKTKKAFQV